MSYDDGMNEEDRWNVFAATNLFKKGLICDR